jgi:quinol monooxygenase YgiN
MSKTCVLVKIDVMPGQFEKLHDIFTKFNKLMQRDPGLECSHVMRDRDDPSKIIIFEIWQSQVDYENHLTNAHCKKFMEDIRGTYGPDGFIKTLAHLF